MLILKLDGLYMAWTTVADGPSTMLLTKEEMIIYILSREGVEGLDAIQGRRGENLEEFGCNSSRGVPAENIYEGNRAGPKESELSREELIESYTKENQDWDGPVTDAGFPSTLACWAFNARIYFGDDSHQRKYLESLCESSGDDTPVNVYAAEMWRRLALMKPGDAPLTHSPG